MKCLVTKFDGSVVNDGLVTKDELLFVVPKNTTNWVMFKSSAKNGHYVILTLRSTSNSVYFCTDNTYSDNLGKSLETGGNAYIKNGSNEDVYMSLSDKDQLIDIFRFGHQDSVKLAPLFVGGEFLQYVPGLKNIIFRNDYIDSKYLAGITAQIDGIELVDNQLPINLNDIKNLTSLTSVKFIAESIRGDIALLSSLVNLTILTITYNTGTSGTLESLLVGLLGNGKTTSLDCFIYNNTNPITFNGSATIYNKHYICSFDTNSITVKIDGNTIGTYNGSTWTYA